jgi:hypothetical protein
LSADITIGFMLADINGNIVQFTNDNTHTSRFDFGTNYSLLNDRSFTYHTPATLADGDYRLWFMYKLANPAITSYSYLANCPNIPRFISVKVQNGVMYFSTPVTESGQLSVTDLSASEEIGAGNKMQVSASISNAGKEYFDNVFFALIDNKDNYKYWLTIFPETHRFIWKYNQLNWKLRLELWFAAHHMYIISKVIKKTLAWQHLVRLS